jgi:hypothetical protein
MEIVHGKLNSLSLKSFCDHCGNITLQTVLSTEVVAMDDGAWTYTLSKCSICEGIILRKHPGDWNAPVRHGDKSLGTDAPLGKDIPHEQLWPQPLILSSEVPERVRQIYQEAHSIKRQSPSSFVVQIRRALEAVAKDKNAQGNTLQAKTEWLIKSGALPEVFGEMTHVSRMIGNLGAHDADKDVSPEDAEIADEFFRAIVEYLYVASDKVARVKKLIRSK